MDVTFAERMLGSLAVIVAMLFALQFFARTSTRRMGTGGDGRLVSVIETTMLPGAASLHVVRVAERYILLGRSGSHIATLSEIPSASVDAWLAARLASPLRATAIANFVRRGRFSKDR